jgi:DNA-binding NtrC family response regulator
MGEAIKALVADDDQTHREIFADLMIEDGMSVEVAEDGEQAVALIERNIYDLVLTDLMMPGRDGIEVLRAARQKNKETLVVIITGFGTLETAIEAIRNGAHDFITKPFKLEELQLVLKNVKEKIFLVRMNRKLKEDLEVSQGEVEYYRSERDRAIERIGELEERLNTYEHNLSMLLNRFPFLLSSSQPASPADRTKEWESYESNKMTQDSQIQTEQPEEDLKKKT